MCDQFSFEEVNSVDWLKDSSQFTEKHPCTHSEVSKQHFLEELLKFPENINEVTPVEVRREKNKVNAKNFRDRKKTQVESMRREIEYLQQQNQSLKNQKYCKWCRKPYSHNVIYSETKTDKPKQGNGITEEGSKDLKMDIQFQKFELNPTKRLQNRGKIWIALGVLMLVLGLSLYGVNGNNSFIKQIQIGREDANRWVEQFKNGKDKSDYIEVKMRVKEEHKPVVKVEPSQLRVLYRSNIELQAETQKGAEESVSINKQFLYSLHAQLDDIGLYI